MLGLKRKTTNTFFAKIVLLLQVTPKGKTGKYGQYF